MKNELIFDPCVRGAHSECRGAVLLGGRMKGDIDTYICTCTEIGHTSQFHGGPVGTTVPGLKGDGR